MDLNVMMREQARAGLATALDTAVTNGDTEAARKIAKDIAALEVSSAPKAPPYGDAEIKAELEKAPWFGIDPKKSARAIDFGKNMDPKKFATAALFAAALVKAVEDDAKPGEAASGKEDEDEDTEGDEHGDAGGDGGEDDKTAEKKTPKQRATDAPGEADTVGNRAGARRSGPWTKLGDAPAAVQAEIKRTAAKFVTATATKEQREKFTTDALASHYAMFQRNKGKK